MVVKRIRPKSRREDAIFEFDEDQRSYLNSPHTLRQIVVAGPGSGKTTVAIQRVVDLDTSLSATQGIEHPSAVLFLSFSRASIHAAAKSMSTDLASLNVEFQAQTIDSLAYEICRYDGQMSLTELDQQISLSVCGLQARSPMRKGRILLTIYVIFSWTKRRMYLLIRQIF